MIYQTSNEFDRQRAITRFKTLLQKGSIIEIIEKKPKRTIKQNSYLHLIIHWFAWEYGETFNNTKQEHFKRYANPEIFLTTYTNPKNGNVREELKSTRDLDTSEMTIAIKNFRDYAAIEAGIYLPEAENEKAITLMEYELKNNQRIK